MDRFPIGVGEKLKFYVYRLIDPRNGETFYIGKGKGDRLFQHVNATKESDITEHADDGTDAEPEDEKNLKIKRINDIRRDGLDVVHIIHRHGIADARTAYEVEAALIDAHQGLSNVSAGHYSNDRGPMHAEQIVAKYALPELKLRDDPLILININSADHNDDDELLDRVRYAWRMSEERAKRAKYVLAVIHGVVRGVFVPEQWLPATAENFPPRRFAEPTSARLGFIGRKADDDVWAYYVGKRGKRLPEQLRHGQNPVRYYHC